MDIKHEQHKEDKCHLEDYRKNPLINFSDSINRSQIGDLRQLTRGGWRHQIITTTVIVIAIILLALSTAGCGASKQELSGDARNHAVSDRAASQEAAPAPTAPSTPEGTARKIIQNARLDMRVGDVPQAVEQISALCTDNGGYTVNSHISRNEESYSAQLSVKVPRDKLESIMDSIARLGEVRDRVVSAQDVTEEYYDAEARLKVLRAKEDRLVGLLAKANTINDIISIENELGKTRGEIEVLAGRLQYLSNATELSLIDISLRQAVPGAIKAPQGTLGKAVQGLISSLNSLIDFASNTVIAIFVILPWILVLVLLLWLSRYVYKRLRHSREPK